ncbi:store-operated calcium entry-associated regulatory factor [Pelobates cultripes]|uniref:Store-operated calcium entry-associated regulatory factor n=1 Tax=Pelobates cultripes TaxID=61616 RepID=A0AAD1SJ20_PELCU|nr:store-operated calcium entry-associated regulatory factor [Pelobates cultripes]
MAAAGMCLALALLSIMQLAQVHCWNQQDRVLLRDIQAITLYSDRYTNSRRTSPVPQLKCTGGSAGCKVMPQVVQCHNRGWDGIDVQWECKVDMDNSYRFGKVEVNCEGFDYPEDPYVLSGSCGLEYTLEYTEEGWKRSNDGSYSAGGHGSGFFQGHSKSWNSPSSSDGSSAVVIVVILVLAYGVYKLFLSGPAMPQQPQPDEYGYGHQTHATAPPPPGYSPPPPGFKSDFTGSSAGYGGLGGTSTFGSGGTQGPGFWTGLGTGGVLGYLFGNRRTQPYQSPYFNNWSGPTYSHGPMYGASQPFQTPQSSGARTTSGFGGTKRR